MNTEGIYRWERENGFQNAEILFPKPVSHPLNGILGCMLFSIGVLQ